MTLGEFRKATGHLPSRTTVVIRSGKRTATELQSANTKLASSDGEFYWLDEGKLTVLVIE